jgi:imidazolonepropionase-like amidohydrolase
MRLTKIYAAAAPTNSSVGAVLAAFFVILALITVPTASSASCADTAGTDLIITGAHIFNAGSDTTSIHISDGLICAVGSEPAQTEAGITIDAQGLTVLPGLIDSHVHLFPMGSSTGINSDASLENFIRDELPKRLLEYLEHGVTTIISVGDAWPAVSDLRRQISAGRILSPRLLITGPILTAPGGYPATTICKDSPWCRSHLTVELRNEDHARQTVHKLADGGVDAIKLVYDDARAKKLDANLVRVIAHEAHDLGLPVIAHATNIADAREVTELGADVLAHLPSGGSIDKTFANQLQQRGVIVISTAGVYAPVQGPDNTQRTVFGLRYGPPFNHLYAQGLANTRTLLSQEVLLAFGSGTAMFTPAQSLNGEHIALSKIPLTTSQLLDAMTINAAQALGRETDLGSIEVGKRADLVIVDAKSDPDNPLSADIVLVIKDGQIVIDRRER